MTDITEHVVKLREDASGWRKIDGPRLEPDDPFLVGLDEDEAENLVRANWALQRSSVEEAQAFYGAAGEEEADSDDEDSEPTVEELIDQGECPWCDEYEGDAVGQHAASAHPDEWGAYKEDSE